MTKPWTETSPGLVEQIRAILRAGYPNLHLHMRQDGAEIRGGFPVRGVDGAELDHYQISIDLPWDFPASLPVVREIGGRIPWHEDFHVGRDGRACVLLPDDRWRCFPVGAGFSCYLEGPLHNFFLGQTMHAQTGEWPIGEWDHGKRGIYQYYRGLLGTEDDLTVRRFLHILAKRDLKKGYVCPCGSGEKIRRCCLAKISDLRLKIPPEVAAVSVSRLAESATPYKGPRVR
ncbi:MAG: hypothetical protein KA020_08485 [Planctomycetes bacterium]|nr:hypothetical protein [Planctomycetota bacterium]